MIFLCKWVIFRFQPFNYSGFSYHFWKVWHTDAPSHAGSQQASHSGGGAADVFALESLRHSQLEINIIHCNTVTSAEKTQKGKEERGSSWSSMIEG